ISGISFRHGGHHVAQKFNNTFFPLKSDSFTVSPSNVDNSKSGAFCPLSSPSPSDLAISPSSSLGGDTIVLSEMESACSSKVGSLESATNLYTVNPSIPAMITVIITFFIDHYLRLSVCSKRRIKRTDKFEVSFLPDFLNNLFNLSFPAMYPALNQAKTL